MLERKYFVYRGFGHIACDYRNRRNFDKNGREKIREPEYQPSNHKFEVLTRRIMKPGIPNKRKEKKEKLLREITVKIELKQEDEEVRIWKEEDGTELLIFEQLDN